MTSRVMPSPRRLPLIGHMHLFRPGKFIQQLGQIAGRFDGVFRLELGGMTGLVVTTAALTAELTDETRFRKVLSKALIEVREILGDGLLTMRSEEPRWGMAHRVLMPAFNQRAMRGYFLAMLEITEQMMADWERRVGEDIVVEHDMSRLTLDIISLAGFGQRFHSFAQPHLHPFLLALEATLREAMARLTQPDQIRPLLKKRARTFDANVATMANLVDEVIRTRRATASTATDLLTLMLNNPDPDTGAMLPDIDIRSHVLTFLAGGHETTGALLTFALYALMSHPGVLAQAYAEIDRVLPGDTRPQYAHMAKLDVIDRVLKECLRLWPTAPAYTVAAHADTTLGGYDVKKDELISVLLPQMHRDPAIWTDPETFDIDRWLPQAEAALPPHCYKPFGSGLRACIGRQFALTEAKLALAMILQRFALSNPVGYHLSIKETLTIKPEGFSLRVRPRRVHERMAAARTPVLHRSTPVATVVGGGRPFTVLYGTRLGTCRDIADHVAERAASQGFAVKLATLDEMLGTLPKSGTLVVITATYNGQPPDTATRTGEAMADGPLTDPRLDLDYALLGCGNTLWPTYQAFPQRLDAALAASGARPVLPRAEADANADFDGDVERWLQAFWHAMAAQPALRA